MLIRSRFMKENQKIAVDAENQILSLVRASLWWNPADESLFKGKSVDWNAIGRLAEMQTVVALIIESALSLPHDLLPPDEWIRKAAAFSEMNRRTHFLLEGCVAEISGCLREEGITNVLLKGQAYARYYPEPAMRQCGDIDLYVGENGFFKAYQFSKKAGWESGERFIASAKHFGCCLRGVRVEFHRQASQPAIAGVRRRFVEWSREQLSRSGRSLSIGGEEVIVPPPLFDLVFVFMHLYLHFLNGGIGLRQICDWTLILHAVSGKIDQEELRRLLKDFRLLKAWRCFAPVAVENLGLPPEECPFYSAKYRRKAARILSIVMREGNFGKYSGKESVRPEGFLRGKLYSFWRQSRRTIGRLPVDPLMVAVGYMVFIKRGVLSAVGKR